MKHFVVRIRQRNPRIEDHHRFLDHVDNLVLALVGIPAALAFGRLVVSWTADAIMSRNLLQWLVTIVAIVVLFNLMAIMFGLFTFVTIHWKSYREETSKAYVSIVAYPLLLVAVGSVIVMGMIAGSDSARIGFSVQTTLSMVEFGLALCLFMISLEALTILLMPDILLVSDDVDVRRSQASPVDALFMITYVIVFIALLYARFAPSVIPIWRDIVARIA